MNAAAFLTPQYLFRTEIMMMTALLLSSALAVFNDPAAFTLPADAFADVTLSEAVQEVSPSQEPAQETEPVPAEPAPAEPDTSVEGDDAADADSHSQLAPELTEEERVAARAEATAALTTRVEAWFEGLTTLSARFEQIGPDGSVIGGELALSRPGRARFDYDDPSPILLVADGSTVAIADFDLETIDRVPLGATPLAPLLSGDERLSATGAVEQAGWLDGTLYLTVIDPEGEDDSRLTLIFEDPDQEAPATAMVLSGWYAVDALGGLTEVRLTAVETGVSFDPRLFILDDEDVLDQDDRRTRRRR